MEALDASGKFIESKGGSWEEIKLFRMRSAIETGRCWFRISGKVEAFTVWTGDEEGLGKSTASETERSGVM